MIGKGPVVAVLALLAALGLPSNALEFTMVDWSPWR